MLNNYSGNQASIENEVNWLECHENQLPAWWSDWQAQLRNAVRTTAELNKVVPLNSEIQNVLDVITTTRRIQLTPYLLRLIRRQVGSSIEIFNHPVWKQVIPQTLESANGTGAYDAVTENWEVEQDNVTPIAQQKYGNRVIVRVANDCFSYCQFCYEALRTLEKSSNKRKAGQADAWRDTLDYIRKNNKLEEVILSGGEPLLLGDRQFERKLAEVREVAPRAVLRVHTRALTFNPFRVTDELCEILKRYDVRAIGLHIAHPAELTADFKSAIIKLRNLGVLLLANTPLLAGVNDENPILRELFQSLYALGVLPYYLYHYMPNSPGSDSYNLPVSRGVALMRSLDRVITGAALPRYVLPHHSGKFTVPVQGLSDVPVTFTRNSIGENVVRFKNWKGEVCEFLNGEEPAQTRQWPHDLVSEDIKNFPQTSPFVAFQKIKEQSGQIDLLNAGNNEATVAPSPRVLRELMSLGSALYAYPDSEASELKTELARKHSVDPSQILVASGVDELIGIALRLVANKHDRVLALDSTYPTFFYHAKALGCDIRTIPYDPQGFPLQRMIEAIKQQKPKFIYIANPDNPSGLFLGREQLAQIIAALPQESLLFLDEAYLDFVEENLHLRIEETPQNVIRARSFSKYYGLAGLRIGYMLGDAQLLAYTNRFRLHFGVSTMAQRCAVAALDDEAYYAQASDLMQITRDRISKVFQRAGFEIVPSRSNFVLVKTSDEQTAVALQARLLEFGIFTRKPLRGSLINSVRVSVPFNTVEAKFFDQLDHALERCGPVEKLLISKFGEGQDYINKQVHA